ncbi:glycosyltransferase family 87 protein [Bradyrhizobium sp. Tv2a-2]|uniref:glycosyltransferase family 87 protein n=1 Tax=Bradyrhizobium sp. Tv2a-2 TaxID=113395 RepID=UPI000465A030|nr:glycosyltransferase family 87 protein [Bradyrhizobium sp. Tv2a-2]
MATASTMTLPERGAIPRALQTICFALFVINASFLLSAWLSHWWIYDSGGLGIPTDFVNVWSAGRLALEGHPAQAWDWDIQKQVQVLVLGQTYPGNFAWHYPPPFLFVAMFLAQFPYGVAFAGWVAASFLPYLAMMRATVGKPFGLLIAVSFPVLINNATVGQNGFLTAALIGGALYFLPVRPVLSGICLGLLTYKPQYGLLFPLVLIAASQWTVFVTAAIVAVMLAAVSLFAFGIESWQAFLHWMPMFSQAFLTEGRAPWFKLQSIFGLVRYLGGSEQLGWAFQWTMTAAVATTVVMIWRSRVRYSLKAASLAVGALLATPYLFLYDMMVLAIPVGYLVRLGLAHGFRAYEVPALALAFLLILVFLFSGLPVGLGATVIVGALVLRRAGAWWRVGQVSPIVVSAAA